MNLVILDLEWNAAYSKKLDGYLNEIIEFGAVKVDETLGELGRFSTLVRPRVSRRMNPYTAKMTHLDLEQLQSGVPFLTAARRFQAWAGDCVILTWGTTDVLTLMENFRCFAEDGQVPFLRRYCDLQRYTQLRLGLSLREQTALSKAAELLALDVSEMAHHRALDDSLMSLEILRRVYDPAALAEETGVCDRRFYEKLTFKPYYVLDGKDPRVLPEYLAFACPACGAEAERRHRWELHGRGFQTRFHCPACGLDFTGRLSMRQKYEELEVKKKAVPAPVIEAPRALVPGPVGSLRLEAADGVGVLRFPFLEEHCPGVNAAFSTRAGGVSGGEFAAMNLGFGRGDPPENVAENYRRFCAAAGFDPESLIAGAQDHHLNIRRVTAAQKGVGIWKEKDLESIDGLCTDEAGLTLVIYCADCVPLYFVDTAHRAIGLAHAGWRGTVRGMAREMAQRMEREFGTRPEDLLVAIGPSISPAAFEVDAPVAEEFLQLPQSEKFVTGPESRPNGEVKYHVDLWECNRQYLLACGVPAEHIAVANVCTVAHSDLLFSHRKTRGRRGSNCAMLALRP